MVMLSAAPLRFTFVATFRLSTFAGFTWYTLQGTCDQAFRVRQSLSFCNLNRFDRS